MKKIAILASGTGSNAENIFNFFSNGNRVKIELVIYDRADAPVAKRMREHNVDTIYIPGEVWRERPDEILEMLSQRGIDLIVLAGFLRFVPEQITRAYAGRMINIHPSLLPAYGGKGMYGHKVHEAVIAAGETRSGATVHYVTDKTDGGDILMQEVVTVTPDDTPDSLEQKVHKAEYSLYPRAIVAALGRLEMNAPEPEEATGASARATQESEAPENPENPEASEAPVPPAREWAETLGVRYDPTMLPPEYPGAVPPPPAPGSSAHAEDSHPSMAPQPPAQGYAGVIKNVYGDDAPPMPPAYLVWSVVMTVLCCLPAGIVAIIFSSQVSSKYYAGDIEGARRSSERAQIWIIVSFVLGVLSNTLYLPIALLLG